MHRDPWARTGIPSCPVATRDPDRVPDDATGYPRTCPDVVFFKSLAMSIRILRDIYMGVPSRVMPGSVPNKNKRLQI